MHPRCLPPFACFSLGLTQRHDVQPLSQRYVWTQEDPNEPGGFAIDAPGERQLALNSIKELKQELWVDKQTRQVSFDFVLWVLLTHCKFFSLHTATR